MSMMNGDPNTTRSDLAAASPHLSRRRVFANGAAALSVVGFSTGFPLREEAHAAGKPKSRTEGYPLQKTPEEWKSKLTERQYDILRNGGTERPYTSILEGEDRPGTFYCAGCGTGLFDSKEKFHSGTGWPSFAAASETGVQVEKVGALQASLGGGAELRCATCGGHLGDVFNDGFLFVGTPAAQSGKRFCIDGAALVFRPKDGGDEVIGDRTPTRKQIVISY
jgi:peptide-methionine (R)-S-oxide reductase